MTTRNFDALFAPKAIALVGGNNRRGSVGDVLARNLFAGGFRGPIMTVSPSDGAIRSTLAYPSVAELPVVPDLAIVATPAGAVPAMIADLAAKGCRAAVVISAGFGEGEQADGAALRQRVLDAAKPRTMRVVGPNCLGVISPGIGLNASFAQSAPAAGNLAFISQSGAVATTMIDWAAGRGVGFSHVLSIGDMIDVDFGDLLDHLATDPTTHAILLYVETITAARKFMSAARVAARSKPVIVVKAGRSAAGARAALSHTGALAGSDEVYDAAFRRAGMLRVEGLHDLFDAATLLASGMQVEGDRLTILTNGGGVGVMAVDALEAGGGRLAPLSDRAREKLDGLLPGAWSHANPVDILGDAPPERFSAALSVLRAENEQDAILVINCPTGVGDSGAAAEAILPAPSADIGPPLLTAWLGDVSAREARNVLRKWSIPTFDTPEDAVKAFLRLAAHRRALQHLSQTPPANEASPRKAVVAAEAIIAKVLHEGRSVLTELEAKALLVAFGIPVAPTIAARTPSQAGVESAVMDLGEGVALKILSPEITHKSDVGGVRLGLAGGVDTEAAAAAMLDFVRAKRPDARLDGFTIQPMITRPGAVELFAGIADDPTFGPVVAVGHGGVAVETMADKALGLAPLNRALARDMIASTRVSRLLAGYRSTPAADIDAVADVLVKLSDLAAQVPEIVELDINPLLVNASGVIALDARVVVRPAEGARRDRQAIRPYPAELVSEFASKIGLMTLRPIRPDDDGALLEMLHACSPDDIRGLSLGTAATAGRSVAAAMTQIDYDRDMTLVAMQRDGSMAAFVRLFCNPNFLTAEFDVLVRSDLQRHGLGLRLVREIMEYARSRGVGAVVGDALVTNGPMLGLARRCGALVHCNDDEGDLAVFRFDLTAEPIRNTT